MGIDDDVWSDSLTAEDHVLLAVLDAAGTLLSVAGGELVTDLRDSHRPHPDLDELVGLRVESDHHLTQPITFESGAGFFFSYFD